MYKIIIVDDEITVREGIRDHLNWHELGFEVVGDYENGREVIEVMEQLQPDVVLTDINMPFVDGLELSRFLYTHYPRTKVIILTGYDEFEYAQQALKLKVHDYIVKPNTADEIRQILIRLKAEMDEEGRKTEDLTKLKERLRESLPLARERFLNQLTSGSMREGELKDKLAYLELSIEGMHHLVAVIDVDDHGELERFYPETESELLYFAVFNISEEIVGKHNAGIVFQNNNEKTIVILSGEDIEVLYDNALIMLEEIKGAVKSFLKFTVSIGVGDVCTGLNSIHLSHKRAASALDYRFLLGKNRVISINDFEGNANARVPYNKVWERKLVSGIKSGTLQEMEHIISQIVHNFKQSYLPLDRCYIHIQQLIISIMDALDELGIHDDSIYRIDSSPLTDIYQLKTLDEIGVWLAAHCQKVSLMILEKRDHFVRVQMMKAEAYIHAHYADELISLDAVCKHVSMSKSYFSLLFKSYQSETFIGYLTKLRVEKAKEMLKHTDLKSYDIADRVGYADPQYFSLIFKKTTGMTTTEYRNRI
ncbi:two-component system, response regulator YesN [Paenibacillus sp. 1_12]|uniref:response regulator n=1 Tax=Paenibacillus sp. 1_12 TaxID=1566278 RepID=UPI0008DEEEFD|nr:response regulator [Paenibacillus sp. 1_12]SFL11775.1 two-component system, response regulator YesN [Paenibacillus sp. 1_12]